MRYPTKRGLCLCLPLALCKTKAAFKSNFLAQPMRLMLPFPLYLKEAKSTLSAYPL